MELSKEEATQFLSDFYFGEHHFPGKLKPHGEGWEMNHWGDLSTYDYNHLTRLVVMAHDRCIRVCILPVNFNNLKIVLHKRERDSDNMCLRHPTLESAVDWIRSRELQRA